MDTTLALAFLPWFPPERWKPAVQTAERAGLDEIWLWEDCFAEAGVSMAAAGLAWTERIRVGVGLFPAPLRNVALLGMELSALAGMFPGRFLGGVGHGVQDWMGQAGVRVDSPLTLLREYLTALRQLVDGDEVTAAGRYVRLDRVRLAWPPGPEFPILAGSSGPRSLAVCGKLAAGTLLSGGVDPATVRRSVELITEARERAGLTGPHPVVAPVLVAVGADAEQRLEREGRAWDFPPGSDLTVTGDAVQVAAGLRRWVDAGATTVVVQPTRDEPDLPALIEFVAHDVRPLLAADASS